MKIKTGNLAYFLSRSLFLGGGISLLFLTTEGDYDLEQDEFYSDLYVVKRTDIVQDEVSA